VLAAWEDFRSWRQGDYLAECRQATHPKELERLRQEFVRRQSGIKTKYYFAIDRMLRESGLDASDRADIAACF
jgi:hypothetical protein